MFASASHPIGVDLGAHTLRLAQLEGHGSGLRVRAVAQRELPSLPTDPAARREALATLLRAALREGPFRGRVAVASLPSAALQVKNVRLPQMPPEEVEQALSWEASEHLGIAVDKHRLQHFDAGDVLQGEQTRREIVLMACAAPVVEERLAVLDAAGLDPIALEVDACALTRALCPFDRARTDAEADVILDVGHERSKVTIVRNGRPVFFKQLDLAGAAFDRAVMSALSCDRAEAAAMRRRAEAQPQDAASQAVDEAVRGPVRDLAREVALCLRYVSVTFRGPRPTRAFLAGGEMDSPVLRRELTEHAGLVIQPANPLTVAGAKSDAIQGAPRAGAWSVAVGLSLRSAKAPASSRRAA